METYQLVLTALLPIFILLSVYNVYLSVGVSGDVKRWLNQRGRELVDLRDRCIRLENLLKKREKEIKILEEVIETRAATIGKLHSKISEFESAVSKAISSIEGTLCDLESQKTSLRKPSVTPPKLKS